MFSFLLPNGITDNNSCLITTLWLPLKGVVLGVPFTYLIWIFKLIAILDVKTVLYTFTITFSYFITFSYATSRRRLCLLIGKLSNSNSKTFKSFKST